MQRIRDSFESKELNVLRWIPGKYNCTDALTKWNPRMVEELHDAYVTELIIDEHLRGLRVD